MEILLSIPKTIHGTKKDAQIELAKFVADVKNGLVIEGKYLKFSEFTEIWKSQNIGVAVVAARLGNAQIITTFNFYVHPIISHNRNAGNVLQNLLLQKN